MMPSRGNKRILLFGDSHLAAAALAVRDAGAEDRFEFWGAAGPEFRNITLEDDGVRPTTTEAVEQVAMVNGRGLKRLERGAFDTAIVVGARLRITDFIVPMAEHVTAASGAVSDPVLAACAQEWLNKRTITMMDYLFADGGDVAFVAAPLSIQRPKTKGRVARPCIAPDGLRRLRRAAQVAMRARGYHLIQQPEDSITDELYTADAHAAFSEQRDFTHVTPTFMKGMLDEALRAIKQPVL
ncbi:MAG: hypothetical protein ABJL67_02685 [Sulfitobacter sp.]